MENHLKGSAKSNPDHLDNTQHKLIATNTRGRLSRIHHWEEIARKADFNVATLSALCGISQRQLERFFKSRFQTVPSLWLRRLQCYEAKKLVAEGYTNKEVAFRLGFASESHFCHVFKKIFGASPQTFAPGYKSEPKTVPAITNVANEQRCRL